jgi:prefoldin subunit 5
MSEVKELKNEIKEKNMKIALCQYEIASLQQQVDELTQTMYKVCGHEEMIRIKEEGDDRAHRECTICGKWVCS